METATGGSKFKEGDSIGKSNSKITGVKFFPEYKSHYYQVDNKSQWISENNLLDAVEVGLMAKGGIIGKGKSFEDHEEFSEFIASFELSKIKPYRDEWLKGEGKGVSLKEQLEKFLDWMAKPSRVKVLLDEWWGEEGFDTMENVTGVKLWGLDEDDQNQAVDKASEIWTKYPLTEKISSYQEQVGYAKRGKEITANPHRQRLIDKIKKITEEQGAISTSDLDEPYSPIYERKSKDEYWNIESFNANDVTVVGYVHETETGEHKVSYEELSGVLLKEIYDLITRK